MSEQRFNTLNYMGQTLKTDLFYDWDWHPSHEAIDELIARLAKPEPEIELFEGELSFEI